VDKEDGFKLFNNSDKMQILEGIYFKEFHSRLIPLVIMNMKKKEYEQSRKKSKLVS
jgi:hypothetical protein